MWLERGVLPPQSGLQQEPTDLCIVQTTGNLGYGPLLFVTPHSIHAEIFQHHDHHRTAGNLRITRTSAKIRQRSYDGSFAVGHHGYTTPLEEGYLHIVVMADYFTK